MYNERILFLYELLIFRQIKNEDCIQRHDIYIRTIKGKKFKTKDEFEEYLFNLIGWH